MPVDGDVGHDLSRVVWSTSQYGLVRGPGYHGRHGANHGSIPKVGEHIDNLLTDLGYNDDAVATLRQSTAISSAIELRSHGTPAGLVYCDHTATRLIQASTLRTS